MRILKHVSWIFLLCALTGCSTNGGNTQSATHKWVEGSDTQKPQHQSSTPSANGPKDETSPSSQAMEFQSLDISPNLNGYALSREHLYFFNTGSWIEVTPPSFKPSEIASLDDVTTSHSKTFLLSGKNLYTSTNQGDTWSSMTLPLKIKNANQDKIHFVDAYHGWILAQGDASMGEHPFELLSTSDGGKTWKSVTTVERSTQTTPIPLNASAKDVAFSDAQNGFLVGGLTSTGTITFYQTHDGGKSWTKATFPSPKGTNGSPEAIATPQFFDAMHGVMAVTFTNSKMTSSWTILYQTKDGTHWAPVSQLKLPSTVTFLNAKVGWTMATEKSVSTSEYQIYQTTDRGKTWTPLSKMPVSFIKMAFTNTKQGWALDQNTKQLYKTIDGGSTWTPKT